jgi:hypothetical protein
VRDHPERYTGISLHFNGGKTNHMGTEQIVHIPRSTDVYMDGVGALMAELIYNMRTWRFDWDVMNPLKECLLFRKFHGVQV